MLLLLNLLTGLLVLAIMFSLSNILRLILGLPFALFFPGYALITALFPSKNALASFERVALSFGSSVAITPLIGLILNYTPWGIRLYPSLISLFVFTIVISAVAWYRQRRLPEAERIAISINPKFSLGQGTLNRILSVIFIVAVLGILGTLGYLVATLKVGEKFTEFYILGTEGKAINYPRELNVGDDGKVTIGIVNREQETASYRIEVRINRLKNSELGPLTLEDGAKQEATVSFRPDEAGQNQKVEFLLYKDGQSAPYLGPLYLWVNVKGR